MQIYDDDDDDDDTLKHNPGLRALPLGIKVGTICSIVFFSESKHDRVLRRNVTRHIIVIHSRVFTAQSHAAVLVVQTAVLQAAKQGKHSHISRGRGKRVGWRF